MDIFIITSTLKPKVGVIDQETRYQQSLETIESIKEKAPDSIIMMLDSSPEPVEDYKVANLKSKINYYISLTSHSHAIELGNIGHKSAGECYIMIVAFDVIRNLNLKNIRRIFKITGRSVLNSNSDISYYDDPKLIGKFVFKTPVVSWISPTMKLVDTRLWSFSYDMIEDVDKMVREAYEKCMAGKLDLEHVYYNLLDKNKLIGKDVIGLTCQISRDGEIVHD